MASGKFLEYQVSDKLLGQEFIATGAMGSKVRSVHVPMDNAHVRTAWVALFGVADVGDAVEIGYSKGKPRLFNSLGRNHVADHELSSVEAVTLVIDWAHEVPAKEQQRVQAKAEREAEKDAWIKAHGSDHLKQIWGEGFHAQLTYVTERLMFEAGDFYELDFYGVGKANLRTDPSHKAMKLMAQARVLNIGEPMVGWLQRPINQDDPEQGEVIYIPNYLGKYLIIRRVT